MTEEEIKKEHKQLVMATAMKEELAEIIQRYCKAKLEPDTVASILFLASQKIMHANCEAQIEIGKLGNSSLIDQLLKKLEEHVKSEIKDAKDKEDKE